MSSPPLLYVECDIPEGVTLGAWRTAHAEGRHHRLRWLRRARRHR